MYYQQQAEQLFVDNQAKAAILTNPELLADYTDRYFTEVVPVNASPAQPRFTDVPGGMPQNVDPRVGQQMNADYGQQFQQMNGQPMVPNQVPQAVQAQSVQRANFPGPNVQNTNQGNPDDFWNHFGQVMHTNPELAYQMLDQNSQYAQKKVLFVDAM
ncbi:MAG: hypothetical protein AAGA83_00350 [Cyanobacteria bacterium P01_F01_bin.116]